MAVSPNPAVDLTTVAAVQSYMQGDAAFTTPQTDEIQREITALSRLCATYCSRIFQRATYNEVRNGTGTATLCLRQSPIVLVNSITVDGVTLNQVTAPGRGNGWDNSDIAVYITTGAFFCRGVRNVVVNYDAGYLPIDNPSTDLPQDLQDSIVMAVADRFKRRTNIGILAKSIAGETITYGNISIPKAVAMIWDQYQKAAYGY